MFPFCRYFRVVGLTLVESAGKILIGRMFIVNICQGNLGGTCH